MPLLTGLSVFTEVALLLAIASIVGLVGTLLRQPLIVAFIATGILVGPGLLGLAAAREHVELLAELGIALLLFLVGLKLDLQLIRSLGPVALATGLGQVVFTSVLGFLIALGLGLDPITAAYVAVALTFSSTIIIVKLLSDKREIDSLHGRIALGFLIVQDIAVVVAMVALSAVGIGTGEAAGAWRLAQVFGSGIALCGGVALFIRHLADPLLRLLARSPELLVTFAVAWAVLLAALGDALGFGKELGGLLGGVSLASSPFREAIAARLASVRDFLLLFFFLALGARLDLSVLGGQLAPSVVLSLFVLIGNPLIVMAIMGWMGYRARTGFLAGLTVAQISEFSLIFMAMGLSLGHVGEDALALVTLVGLVTITLSTYMIVHAQRLHAVVEPLLGPFERRVAHREQAHDDPHAGAAHDAIILGLGRYGQAIARVLRGHGWSVLGVDFDPEVVSGQGARGQPMVYGDAADPELIAALPLQGVRWVIFALPAAAGLPLTHADPRRAAIAALRERGYRGLIAVAHAGGADAQTFAADLVLEPFPDAAERAVERLIAATDTAGAASIGRVAGAG
jgi:Kef-type K+ transport system membrane component KefB